jgi:hypothetical protein
VYESADEFQNKMKNRQKRFFHKVYPQPVPVPRQLGPAQPVARRFNAAGRD